MQRPANNARGKKAGQRFDAELAKALDTCDVFVAVIGPRWMDLLRQRQVDDEYNYVRTKIAAALQRVHFQLRYATLSKRHPSAKISQCSVSFVARRVGAEPSFADAHHLGLSQ